MTTNRRHDLLAVGFVLLLPTLFFWDVLFGTNNLYLRDLARFHYPGKQILRDVVRGGEFPYWNRMLAAGQPLAANPQHEVFYPPNWLIFLPDYDLGFHLQILFHIYLAAAGMYLLLRSMELGVVAAVFGAISFSMGGLLLSLVNLLPLLYCAAWLPLTCLFTRRFMLQRRPRDLAFAAASLALQLLVGEPTMIAQTGILLGFYALYSGWRNLLRVALICAAAAGLAAVQIIPMIDHVRGSIRSQPLNFDLVAAWSMPIAKLGELMFPNLLGHAWADGTMWYWAGRLYPGLGSPYLLNLYCGLAVAALAAAALVTRARGWLLVTTTLLVSVTLALGAYTPVLGVLYDAGVMTSVRYPEKFVFLGVFSLIVFAASALHRILEGDQALATVAAGFALATGVIAAAISLLGFTPLSVDGFLLAWGLPMNAGTPLLVARAWTDWSIAGARAVALVLLLLTVTGRRRAIWPAAAVLFLVVDLALAGTPLTPRMPRALFTQPPALAGALPPERTQYRIFHEADWEKATGPGSFAVARNGLFPPMNVAHGIASVMERDFDKSNLMPTTEFGLALSEIRKAGRPNRVIPLMAMSNAWFRIAYSDGTSVSARPVVAQPRYYFADQIVEVAGRDDFARKILGAPFSQNVAFISGQPFVPARGVVRGVRETANRATIDVESAGRGLLVMSVTPHKYWRITVGGQAVEPVIANIGYQAVPVPPGRHRVEMRYRNPLVGAGAGVSFITALMLIAWSRRRAQWTAAGREHEPHAGT